MKLFTHTIVLLIFIIAACQKDTAYTPNNLYELRLKQKITGKEAEEFVNRLHHQSVTREKNEVAFYEGSKGAAIIYITYYQDEEAAIDNYQRMTKKISPENSVFIHGSFLEIEGKQVYRTFGMGQTHFVFVVDKSLFWISAESVWAKDFFISYLKYLS